MLSRLIDRLRAAEPKSIQYELQRMSWQGGWKAVESLDGYPDYTWTEDPPTEPLSVENLKFANGPGRYRLIQRVDGRIDEALWTRKTPDAEQTYDQTRTEHHQRERLAELVASGSIDEFQDLRDRDAFDQLSRKELTEAHERLMESE